MNYHTWINDIKYRKTLQNSMWISISTWKIISEKNVSNHWYYVIVRIGQVLLMRKNSKIIVMPYYNPITNPNIVDELINR